MLADLGQELAGLVGSISRRLGRRKNHLWPSESRNVPHAVRGLVAIYTMDYLYRDLNLDAGLCASIGQWICGWIRRPRDSPTERAAKELKSMQSAGMKTSLAILGCVLGIGLRRLRT